MGLLDKMVPPGIGDVLKLLTPENMAIIQETIPKFIADLRAALGKLLERSRSSESMLVGLTIKTEYIANEIDAANSRLITLMSASALTPDIVSETIGQANADPRNQPGYVPPEIGATIMAIYEKHGLTGDN